MATKKKKTKGELLVTLVHEDGRAEALEPDESLEKMQKAVKGYVEVVRLDARNTLLVNEEGMLKQMPVNAVASRLAGQMLVGPVVVLENSRDWV